MDTSPEARHERPKPEPPSSSYEKYLFNKEGKVTLNDSPLGCQLPASQEPSPLFENLLYDDALYATKVQCDLPFMGFAIWIYMTTGEEDSGSLTFRQNCFIPLDSEDDIRDWVNQPYPNPPRDTEFIGGLHLLVQEWPKHFPVEQDGQPNRDDAGETRFVHRITKGSESLMLPFSQETMQLMIERFHVPPSYFHDMISHCAIPLRLKWLVDGTIGEGPENNLEARSNLGIIVQSPKSYHVDDEDDSFVSTCLSYNPITKVTTGFLGYVKGTGLDSVLKTLATGSVVPLASHPLLVPSLILLWWHDYYEASLIAASRELREVQKDNSSKMERVLSNLRQSGSINEQEMVEFIQSLNDDPLAFYQSLLNGTFPFITDLGKSCLEAFQRVRWLKETHDHETHQIESAAAVEKQLEGFLLYLNDTLEAFDHRRGRLLSRMLKAFEFRDQAVQVILGFATVQLSIAAKNDSSRMKQISFLTFLFLPATVIATIFGMLEFFTVEDGELKMSPTIKVYWEIVGPVTLAFMIYWVIWAYCSNNRPKEPPPGGLGLSQRLGRLRDILSRSPTPPGPFTTDGKSPANDGLEDLDLIRTYYEGRENSVDIEKNPIGRVMPQ